MPRAAGLFRGLRALARRRDEAVGQIPRLQGGLAPGRITVAGAAAGQRDQDIAFFELETLFGDQIDDLSSALDVAPAGFASAPP